MIKSYSDLRPNPKYELVKEEYLPDIKTNGIVLRHIKSGARVCLLPADDSNKVFCAGFRTTPTDSTGVPHIIEHTVLNGSKHFPSRDPFMQLAKGSLNTFLNAITWPDKTMYPVASCNDKDFSNLMHVYLDAVFFPNIYSRREIFMQEGWHYEMETPDDELKINGVVYSEMKGAMSSPDRQIYDELLNVMLPDTTYGVNSGGDPEVIPTLTYENYLNFHRRYYHPSNSYIFLYGDMDMDERLEFMDREYLSLFDAISPDSDVARQPHFCEKEPKKVEISYPVGSEEDTGGKTYFAFASLAGESANSLECRAYSVLSDVLIESDSAPVKNALIDAGIGEEVYGGFEEGIDEVFTVIAKNADENDGERFVKIIRDTLEAEVGRGISEKALMASLNRTEFEFREADGGRTPIGLGFIIAIMGSWLYDENKPFAYMHTLDDIAELKKRIGTGYYEELVKKYILDSDHSVLLTMKPEKGLVEKRENALKEKLAAYKASLTKEEIDGIVASTKALREYQSAPATDEEKNCIPSLERADIKREGVPFTNREGTISGRPLVFHDVDTNGITYLNLAFRIPGMPKKYVPYLGLLADVLCGIDTEKHTYSDIDIEIKLNTGNIDFDPITYGKPDGSFTPVFKATASFMPENTAFVFDMLGEIITTSKFTDKKRMAALLAEIKSGKQREIMSAGHTSAVSRAMSYFDSETCYRESLGGLDYYFFIKDLAENFDKRADECADSLAKVAALVFDPANLIVSLACPKNGHDEIERLLPAFCDKLDTVAHVSIGEAEEFVPVKKNEGVMIPSQVQYVGRAGEYRTEGLDFNGYYSVVQTAVNTDYLYQQIRVRGGAYGAGCRFGNENGVLSFYSYRDPNLKKTDEVYCGTSEFVRAAELDEKDLTKYIIGSFSASERPLSPRIKAERSFFAYMTGDTTEKLNGRRASMLDITKEQFTKTADVFDAVCRTDCFCVVGNEKTIRENKDMFGEIVKI